MAPVAGTDRRNRSTRVPGAARLRPSRRRDTLTSTVSSTITVLLLVVLVVALVLALGSSRRAPRPRRGPAPHPAPRPAAASSRGGPKAKARRRVLVAACVMGLAALVPLGLAAAGTRSSGQGTVLAAPAAVHGRGSAPDPADGGRPDPSTETPTATAAPGTGSGAGPDPAAEASPPTAKQTPQQTAKQTSPTSRATSQPAPRATSATSPSLSPTASTSAPPAPRNELAGPARSPATTSPTRVVPLPPSAAAPVTGPSTTLGAPEPPATKSAAGDGPVALAPPAATGLEPSVAPSSAPPVTVASGGPPELAPARIDAVLAGIDYPWRQRLGGWTLAFLPGRPGLRGLTYVQLHRIEIYVRPEFTDQQVVDVVAHELGHAVDVTLLDNAARVQWLTARGLPASTPWFNVDEGGDFGSGSGDFAEAFAGWQVGKVSQSRLAGPLTPPQLALLATLAGG